MKRIVLAISLALMATAAKAQCAQKIQIESILVDACNNSALEPNNEMVRFKNGSNSLNISQISIAGAPASGIFAANKWPTNGLTWNGLIQSATTASVTAALQATVVSSCGKLIEPPSGIIPANADVLMICSDDPSITDNSFANLIDTLYIVYHNATYTVTTGHFVNYTTPSSTRGLIIFDNAHGCSDTAIYDPSLLSGHNNGDAVAYDIAGNATYYNDGCQAAFVPIQVTVSGPASACGTVSLSGVISGPAASYSWTTSGTGVFSVSTGTLNVSNTTTVTSTYTLGAGESGTVTFTLTAQGTCPGATATSTLAVTINPAPTPTISSTNGASICNGNSTILSVNNQAGTTYSWSPGGSTATSITVTPTNTATPTVYTVSASSSCGTTQATFTVAVNPLPILTIPTDSICKGTTGTLTASGATTYTWNTGATGATFTVANVNSNATYTVTGTDAATCTNTAVGNIIVRSNPVITIPNDTICKGTTGTLTASGATTYTWNTGATGATFTVANVNSNATYTVTGADANTCTNTAVGNIIVRTSPVVSALPTTICPGTTTTLTATGASTYTWSTSATTPSIVVTPTVNTTYTVTGTDINGCVSATATTSVTLSSSSNLTVTASVANACSNVSFTLTASGANANTYTWTASDGTSIPSNGSQIIVTQTASVTYTVAGSLGGGCTTTPATITVNVVPPITINIVSSPTNAAVCQGNSIILTASGASTYTWMPSIINGVGFIPASSQTYSVTGTDVNGCTGAATQSITVNSNPTVTVNSPTICAGGTATLTASGASTYTWSTTATTVTTTVNPMTIQIYTVAGTDINGCMGITTATVSINALPTIIIPNDSICRGSTGTLTASGASTYTWNTSATGATFTVANVNSNATYTVTGTDANTCTNTAVGNIIIRNPPTLTVNSPTICIGSTATLTANGATTYTWSTTATTVSISVTPTITTSYSVTGTDANGCISAIATSTVSINALPIITIPNDSICRGTTGTLTASGATTYTWNTSAAGATFTVANVNSNATYTVTGTDANTCTNTSVGNIIVRNPPTITVNSPTICAGNTTTLTANGATTYTWSTGSLVATTTVNPTVVTDYTVTGTDVNSCTATATATVNIYAAPTINISTTSPSICLGQGSATLTASGATTYTWSTGVIATSITISPAGTQTYAVAGTDGNGCISSAVATTTITVNTPIPITISSSSGATVCAGATTTLTASGATTYTWNNGTTLNTNAVNPTINPTTYSVNGTDINGCKDSNTVSITINQLPIAQTVRDTFVCKGGTTTLTETNSSYTYYWTGPAPSTATVSTNPSISITQGGIYTLHTVNSCGDIPTTFSVTKDSLRPSFVASPTTGIVPVSVSFTNTSTGNSLTYSWNFGDGDNSSLTNPSENYTSAGVFQAILTSTDNLGCKDTASIKIKVNEIPTVLVIPNVFTPNGDNINDIFNVTATGISNLDCKVYDRWGLLLHEWTGVGGGWDGKGKNGNYCTDGVYFYLISYDDNQGKLCKKDGFFELIR